MKKYFSFSGRARRTEYWITYFVVSILGYVLEALSESSDGGVGIALLIVLLSVLIIWIGLAVGARRCHDLGHNGFWQLIPFYGIWMAFVNGQPGPNEYGENPKGE
ncbi:MAG: DUF805 domain-containing protein [Bacteroidales bacterium]|nr:DUF805 domain-containing protein [Bacteroidales bacterium]MBR0300674.1 DUF805 domain-containing protein [Bacteroidales bacterium]